MILCSSFLHHCCFSCPRTSSLLCAFLIAFLFLLVSLQCLLDALDKNMSITSIVDSHIHLWDPKHIPVRWLNDSPALNRPHVPSTLSEELKNPSKISISNHYIIYPFLHLLYLFICILFDSYDISASFVPPNVEAIVYVETDTPASYTLLETEWVAKLAGEDKRIQVFIFIFYFSILFDIFLFLFF